MASKQQKGQKRQNLPPKNPFLIFALFGSKTGMICKPRNRKSKVRFFFRGLQQIPRFQNL